MSFNFFEKALQKGAFMNIISNIKIPGVVAIYVEPGRMLLESITEAAGDIKNGAVIAGVGTLKSCKLHCVTGTTFPPDEEFITLQNEPLELVSLQGIIADGKPHLHAVVSRGFRQNYSGHLEYSSEVLYLAEILLIPFENKKLTRRLNTELGVAVLQEAD
jgi:predicted DNA-binding protein with PD1-like motif